MSMLPTSSNTFSSKTVNGTLGTLVGGTIVEMLIEFVPYIHDHLSSGLANQLIVLIAAGIGFFASYRSTHKPTVAEVQTAIEASNVLQNEVKNQPTV
jgi:hypothetical protein